eukprot:m.120882 g.120882  ORF g.120882 m.120882 type:complete len:59 (-) comp9375_c0_seq11:594-770(-)
MIPGVSRCMYCLVASIFVEVVPGFVDGIVTLELLYSVSIVCVAIDPTCLRVPFSSNCG